MTLRIEAILHRGLLTAIVATLFTAVDFGRSPALAFGVAPPVAWTATLSGSYGPDVSRAPGGGVYVSGYGPGIMSGRLIRLDSVGHQIWSSVLTDFYRPLGVTTDRHGNALVIGDNKDVGFVRKYAPGGNLLWHQDINSPLYDSPSGIAVDSAGNSYASIAEKVVNYGIPPAGTLHQLYRLGKDGDVQWQRGLDTGDGTYPGNGISWSDGAVVDRDGHIVTMFNNYSMANHADPNSYLAKTTRDGQVLWVKKVGEFSNVFSIDVDSENNIYAALNDRILKWNADGEEVWSVDKEPVLSLNLFSLTIGPGDRIFVGGQAGATLHPSGALRTAPYAAEYSAAGQLLWSDIRGVGIDEAMSYIGMTVSRRQLIATSTITRNNAYTDTFVLAYSLVPEPGSVVLCGLAVVLFLPSRSSTFGGAW